MRVITDILNKLIRANVDGKLTLEDLKSLKRVVDGLIEDEIGRGVS